MTNESTAKKDIQKLQRAIVDGLEDVKGQDIVVFNTAELSPLFERVIIASGTSNRQTKALAASVRDAVREAGFDKPRIEGEENGEWIIIDCGQAVAHVMQPVIRQYYRLEEIWGTKPVRLKHGTDKPTPAKLAEAAALKAAAKKAGKAAEPAAKAVAPKSARAVAKSTAAKPAAKSAKPAATAKPAAKAPATRKPAAKSAAPAKKTGAPRKPAAALPKLVVNKPAKAKSASAKPAAKATAKPAAKKKA